jgi:protein O-mannosyl-transferase
VPGTQRADATAASGDGIKWLVAAVLAAATWAALAPVVDCDFVNMDDPQYVTANVHVRQGLGLEGVAWAFDPSTRIANWQPVALLSHMLDVELYGLDPRGHHRTSLLLHVVDTVLLFLVLNAMTGALWKSAVVAALFGVHPLHVESVAWISERKDVLSTFFGLLAIASYTRFTRAASRSAYALACVTYACSLMAKPMLVTLPLLLLLLDYWPLGRLPLEGASAPERAIWRRRIVEKLPLLALALVFSVFTLLAQRSGGAVASMDRVPLAARIENAVVAYAAYLGKMVWPRDLAAFYPHPGATLPGWKVALSAGVLLGASGVAVRARRRVPAVAVGWLWYLGTLVPVIGLVQVGAQGMADRYTYFPMIGVAIAATWGAAHLAARWRVPRLAAAAVAASALVPLAAAARLQTAYWRDSVALFEHALAVSGGHHIIHDFLGKAYAAEGRLDDAMRQYEMALALEPRNVEAREDLGTALIAAGRNEQAIAQLREVLRLAPGRPLAAVNLGAALERLGRVAEALEVYRQEVAANPEDEKAQLNLALLLSRLGRYEESLPHYRKVIALRPDLADAHNDLGNALMLLGRWDEAESEYRAALRIEPLHAHARSNLDRLLARRRSG